LGLNQIFFIYFEKKPHNFWMKFGDSDQCASASSSDMLPSLTFSVELVLSSIQSENQQEQKKEALIVKN
jgi:hypothetical protein